MPGPHHLKLLLRVLFGEKKTEEQTSSGFLDCRGQRDLFPTGSPFSGRSHGEVVGTLPLTWKGQRTSTPHKRMESICETWEMASRNVGSGQETSCSCFFWIKWASCLEKEDSVNMTVIYNCFMPSSFGHKIREESIWQVTWNRGRLVKLNWI